MEPSLTKASIIIPVYNEEDSIALILDEIAKKLTDKIEMEIIVVDDGSADATYEVALEAGVKTVRTRRNYGYSEAVKIGVSHSSFSNVVIFESSGKYDPIQIIDGIKLITESKADVAIASDITRSTFRHRLGYALISFALRVLFELKIRGDVSSTFICARKAVFDNLELTSTGFTLGLELLIKANAKGFHVADFPVKTRKRLGEKSLRTSVKLRWVFQYYYLLLRSLYRERP